MSLQTGLEFWNILLTTFDYTFVYILTKVTNMSTVTGEESDFSQNLDLSICFVENFIPGLECSKH